MSRRIEIEHPDKKVFWDWERSQITSTGRQYVSEVARFLRETEDLRLVDVSPEEIMRYREGKSARSISALNHFFQFALERGYVRMNPVQRAKNQRRAHVSNLQTDFFEQLLGNGVQRRTIKQLRWRDFVVPIALSRRSRTIRVHNRNIVVDAILWKNLENEFRTLLSTNSLEDLLQQKIAV